MKKSIFPVFALVILAASTVMASAQATSNAVSGSNPRPQAVSGSNPRPQAVSGSNPRPQTVAPVATGGVWQAVLAFFGL
jgi:hypothetical protein